MAGPELHVGRTLRNVASEAAEMWKAAASGETTSLRRRIHFQDLTALSAVLTPSRCELLLHLKREPASDVHVLADALGRDLVGVGSDVTALAELGLLTRGIDGSLSSDFDGIDSIIHDVPSPRPLQYELPPEIRELAEKSVDQARRAFDGFMTAVQKATGPAGSTAGELQTDAHTTGTTAMGFAETNIRSAFDLAARLVRAKDLQEVMALQAEYAKTQMTTAHEQARELGTIVQPAARSFVPSTPPETRTRRHRTDPRRP